MPTTDHVDRVLESAINRRLLVCGWGPAGVLNAVQAAYPFASPNAPIARAMWNQAFRRGVPVTIELSPDDDWLIESGC